MSIKVSGFTFIRNAIQYDYPIVESIQSLLPVVDELVVAVGKSDDGTLGLIQQIQSPKIKIIETVWNDALREGGRVLADETQKALSAIDPQSVWAFYLQGDEVLHEADAATMREAMLRYADDRRVEGLLFNYKHFYGSYDYIGNSRRWYRKEIRVVRNTGLVRSYKDAQGFRKADGSKLAVKAINASIYHYGWVKPPEAQMQKQKTFNKYWHDDQWMKQHIPDQSAFDYSNIDSLALFEGTHPRVMQDRIAKKNWKFAFDITRSTKDLRTRLSDFFESLTGYRLGEYKNYKKI